MPVETTSGRPVAAQRRIKASQVRSPLAILNASTPTRSSRSTADSDSGVASTARPRDRARATTSRCAASSSSKAAKNVCIEAALTCAGAGASAETSSEAIRVWSFTADAPASAAASTSASARSIDPPWFSPISAMVNSGWPTPTRRPAISIAGARSPDIGPPVLRGHQRRGRGRQRIER
jgi:hypothetical protein